MIGQTLSHYKIISKLGQGGQGEVYLAEDSRLDRKLSAKLMMGFHFPRTARKRASNPLWNHYQCQDGKWLCLGMLQSDRISRTFVFFAALVLYTSRS